MRPSPWILAAIGLALAGCEKDRARDEEPVSVPVPKSTAPDAGPPMRVVVSSLLADPTIDAQGVRSAFRDAETSLLGCVDSKGGAGVLALSFPVEHDGTVGTVVERSTTLRDERARRCITQIVKGMRFSSTTGSRPEIAVVLEARPRRAVE